MPHISWITDRNADLSGRLTQSGYDAPWVNHRPPRSDKPVSARSLLAKWTTRFEGRKIATPPFCAPEPAMQDTDALVHEAQHRMANSVQIIASILQHSLRDTSSAEARLEIEAAYQRIMSVASLQRSLFETNGRVAFAPYLYGIGQRIGQSLLVKGGNVRIRVLCRPITLEAETATNIGLVVTELLINAIKHAFPDGRRGTICVSFHPQGAGWILAVSDNGVGRSAETRHGLGSRIVPALAMQLGAELTEQHARPGSRLLMIHR